MSDLRSEMRIDSTTRGHVRGLAWLALIVFGVAGVVVLSACEPAVRGVVVEKDYDPPVKKTPRKSGKKADYDITVRPDGAPGDGSDDVEIDVNASTYHSYEIGDRYPK